jgi:hypothetical protein
MSQWQTRPRNRLISDAIHDPNSVYEDLAFRAIPKRQSGQKPVLTSFAILTVAVDSRFAIEVRLVGRHKHFLCCGLSRRTSVNMDLNGISPPLLTGPTRDEKLISILANAIDVADDATCAGILTGRF